MGGDKISRFNSLAGQGDWDSWGWERLGSFDEKATSSQRHGKQEFTMTASPGRFFQAEGKAGAKGCRQAGNSDYLIGTGFHFGTMKMFCN